MDVRSIKKYKWKEKKALIVEDDHASSFLLSEILSHTQIRVRIVGTGTEAVEVCKSDPDLDIVLMDMQVPGISGFEAAKKIRKIRPELPIIAQSAFVMRVDRERAIEAGCNAHVSKPLDTFELLGIMHQMMHKTDRLPI